ncbi:MAG: Na/Pi cotransporter family protein, partial [Alphaproteobacteria bacterium]|nr:Na/Pi cotransporter family protein [Alphaproteobacteria bacterium]
NIGTPITAIIGDMSSNYQGKRLAAAHLVFNVVTGAIAIVFIPQFVWAVEEISATVGIPADDYALKLAVFHTIFNVIGVAVMVPFTNQLVNALQRAIPKPKVKAVEPRYISDNAFEFPETLINAVHQETIHLYDNALEVMTRGLNLERHAVEGDGDLAQHVESSAKRKSPYELEQAYAATVKPLYADILDFISKAHTSLPAEFGARLYELREASHAIVAGVKGIQHLRKNALVYMNADNADIRDQYNAIRAHVAGLMRAIHDLAIQDEDQRDVLALDDFKIAIEDNIHTVRNALDDLIRDKRITAIMASSLMNDLDYAQDVIRRLSDMAKALYGARDAADKEVEGMVALTDEDISDMQDEPTP